MQLETASQRRGGAVGTVAEGAAVEVEWPSGERATYVIVADRGANLAEQRISIDSPLARAILGARVGEVRTFSAARNVWNVKVIRVDGGQRGF